MRPGRRLFVTSLSSPDAAAIISESLARHLWPNGEAVGIASDVRQTGLTDKASAIIYQPYLQIKQPGFLDHISFVVQSNTAARRAARVHPATALHYD